MSVPRFTRAVVRPPGPTYASGLTTSTLGPPNLSLALEQHAEYCAALADAGLAVQALEPIAALPDSTFVEDTAVLTPRIAILARPGALSREDEVPAIAPSLDEYFPVFDAIVGPGSLDGGDVCDVGGHFLIGLSERTNAAGAEQLAGFLADHGYSSQVVNLRRSSGLLHLKSGVSWLQDDLLLVSEELASHPALRDYRHILVPPSETYAANCVSLNGRVLLAAGHRETAEQVRGAGMCVIELQMSEFQKMDGGLSCLSLRFSN